MCVTLAPWCIDFAEMRREGEGGRGGAVFRLQSSSVFFHVTDCFHERQWWVGWGGVFGRKLNLIFVLSCLELYCDGFINKFWSSSSLQGC